MQDMHNHATKIITQIISENMPDKAVKEALQAYSLPDKLYLVAIGKAAWTMTKAACDYLGDKIHKGVAITKYGHSQGEIFPVAIYEAGHPIPDDNSIKATEAVLDLVSNLGAEDTVLFLVSGGGSALFESPKDGVTLDDLQSLTKILLEKGAAITEINALRKRLSKVKAGGFAEICKPASIFSIVLSDVLEDRLDTIASGPAAPDMTTREDALRIAKKYKVDEMFLHSDTNTADRVMTSKDKTPITLLFRQETPKSTDNVKTVIVGSVRSLCKSAADCAKSLGYTPYVLTTSLGCEAAEAGKVLAAIARDTQAGLSHFRKPCAIIMGGETIVHVKGNGKGGRNQEMALAAAKGIAGLANTIVFALGSDGTDGPTDAAGGIVNGDTLANLTAQGLSIDSILANNDSYNGLKAVDGLIITGPTGTNVNDVAVLLCV